MRMKRNGEYLDRPYPSSGNHCCASGIAGERRLNLLEKLIVFLGDIPRRNAFRYPDQIAFDTQSGCLTWSRFNERVNLLANSLTTLGLKKSDRIAILAAPCIEAVETYFAAAKLGLVIVPLHTGLVEKEISFMLSDVGAKVLVFEQEFIASIHSVLPSLMSATTSIVVGAHEGCISYETLFAHGNAAEPNAAVDEEDLFAIRYTSGTTGLPKGCPSTHRDWLRRSVNFLAHVNHSHKDSALLFAPLSLGVGSSVLMTYSYVGARITIQRRFDAADILRTIESKRISTFLMPLPNLFAKLLDDPLIDSVDLRSLRIVGYGGGIFPVPLMLRTLERFRCDFFGVYGTLEAGGFSTYLLPEDHRLDGCSSAEREVRLKRLGSCGREAMQADIRVVDENGKLLPPGKIGEMIVRTDGMIADYWNRPGEINNSLRNGWFFVGDAASIDEDGYVYISDRLKDVIRTGGMNVSSVEVENVLLDCAGLEEAAVVGIPDPRWGEAIVAFVVRKENAIDEDAVIAHCRRQLAKYKVPKKVEFCDALPKNSMGKVLKRELRKSYVQADSQR
jgi:acyl-CoA synthetase (AMP-forming)/AMP-acid ligase II